MWSWQMRSISPVVMPTSTQGAIMSSTSAAKRPASRMPSSSAAVFGVTALIGVDSQAQQIKEGESVTDSDANWGDAFTAAPAVV